MLAATNPEFRSAALPWEYSQIAAGAEGRRLCARITQTQALREFNDEELRRWVEVEGKTQTEIAKIVGRTQARISQRCRALDITPSGKGRPHEDISAYNDVPDAVDAEVVDGEVVEEPRPARRKPQSRYADDNLRTQLLRWFSQGQQVRDLLRLCRERLRPIPI